MPAPTASVVLTVAGRVRNGNSEPAVAGAPGGLATPATHKAAVTPPAPAGAAVVTQGLARFDMAMLAAMPQHRFSTATPWYANTRRFAGPLLRDVLASAGAQGETLRLIALNDYRVDMPFLDAQRFDVVVARLLDGQPMAVRDKGPLFVIYPFDSQRELRSAVYYSRCAWQLRQIDVL